MSQSVQSLRSLQPVPDRYEREEIIAAPRDRVWAALTEPEQLVAWFAAPTYPLEPGGVGVLRFGDGGATEVSPVEVVAVDPPHRFAFRWRASTAGAGEPRGTIPSTLVEFTLTDAAGGTRVRVVESGFAALPEAVRAASLRDNTQGWDEALRNLAAYLDRMPGARRPLGDG